MADALLARGLHVSPAFVAAHSPEQQADADALYLVALNSDLRKSGEPFLRSDFHNEKKLEGSHALQLVSVLNIAQPAAKQGVPGLHPQVLQLRLTDGALKVTAIEVSPVPQLSVSLAPGTKLLVTKCPIRNGKLLISGATCSVLGGRVDELYSSWKANKELKEKNRIAAADKVDPPPTFTTFVMPEKSSEKPKTKNTKNDKVVGKEGKSGSEKHGKQGDKKPSEKYQDGGKQSKKSGKAGEKYSGEKKAGRKNEGTQQSDKIQGDKSALSDKRTGTKEKEKSGEAKRKKGQREQADRSSGAVDTKRGDRQGTPDTTSRDKTNSKKQEKSEVAHSDIATPVSSAPTSTEKHLNPQGKTRAKKNGQDIAKGNSSQENAVATKAGSKSANRKQGRKNEGSNESGEVGNAATNPKAQSAKGRKSSGNDSKDQKQSTAKRAIQLNAASREFVPRFLQPPPPAPTSIK